MMRRHAACRIPLQSLRRLARVQRRDAAGRAGRIRRADRRVRRRQVDAAELHRRARRGRPRGACGSAATRSRSSTKTARARLRRDHLGFVFQAFHVLPHLTVAQNVELPLLQKRHDGARAKRARGRGAGGPRAAACRGSCRAASCSAWRSRAPWCTPGADPGRRTDRQPRPRHRRTGARRAAEPGTPERRRLPAGDAFAGRRGARRPHAAAPGTRHRAA